MIYYSKIIDAEFKELTDEPLPVSEPKKQEGSKVCLAINLILLSFILRLLWANFF